MLAVACDYEDTDDCDSLRFDPLFKLAVGRAPGKRPRAVFAADHEPVGGHAVPHRSDAADGGACSDAARIGGVRGFR